MESPLSTQTDLLDAVAALAIGEQWPVHHQEVELQVASEDPYDPRERIETTRIRLATSLSQPCPSSSHSSNGVDPPFAMGFVAIVTMLEQSLEDLVNIFDLMSTYNIRPDNTMLGQARRSVARYCHNIDNLTLNLEAQVNRIKRSEEL